MAEIIIGEWKEEEDGSISAWFEGLTRRQYREIQEILAKRKERRLSMNEVYDALYSQKLYELSDTLEDMELDKNMRQATIYAVQHTTEEWRNQ